MKPYSVQGFGYASFDARRFRYQAPTGHLETEFLVTYPVGPPSEPVIHHQSRPGNFQPSSSPVVFLQIQLQDATQTCRLRVLKVERHAEGV